METQTHMDATQGEAQRERTDEMTEEQFLKVLYLFMKTRDTPIERIPHLGFKQIDLFLMFTTVRDLGGYHQVTAQQMWKQVYNRLGGNPRSTSAATCTRRHYEKLLLPYECHVKGILMSALPQHTPKHFHFANYNKDEDEGQRPAKRKLLSIPLQQSPHNLQSTNPHGGIFPLPLHYPHYYHPNHTVLPSYAPIPSSSPPALKTQFAFHSSFQNPRDRAKEPLEQLRQLAEQYKTSSGLAEPLNLSVKALSQEADRNPLSSFAPPSTSKNPKFLNKPSPLYTPQRPLVVVRSEDGEVQEVEADGGLVPYSNPAKAGETYVIDVKAITAPSSSTLRTATERTATTAQKPCSPKTDCSSKEAREGSPEPEGLNLSDILPNLPPDKAGNMEIHIPLSMFHSWLKMCGSSAVIEGAKQLPAQEEYPERRDDADVLPTNLSFHRSPRQPSPAAEDLRLRQMRAPSPVPNIQASGSRRSTSQNHFTGYTPLPVADVLRNTPGRDVYPVDQLDISSRGSKHPNCWDGYDKESCAPHAQVKTDSSPLAPHNFAAAKPYGEDAPWGGNGRSETGPSAMLMMNSGSASVLHLTNEEVMKLKKIISSSM